MLAILQSLLILSVLTSLGRKANTWMRLLKPVIRNSWITMRAKAHNLQPLALAAEKDCHHQETCLCDVASF